MPRRWSVGLVAAAVMALGKAGMGSVGVAGAAVPISVPLPESMAFSVLGHSCGGIQESAYATGFDATSGYPVGDVYLQTSCSSGGRGSHPSTYSAWVGVTWDFTSAVVSYAALSTSPTVDPTLPAFDAYGNEVYNVLNTAYLNLAPTFVPVPRVTALSVTSGPAAGGTSVTITGTGFTGVTAVDFGATATASFTFNGDSSITAVSPVASAGTVDVTVTTAGGTTSAGLSDQFTFVAAPVVSAVSPGLGTVQGGATVTVTGAAGRHAPTFQPGTLRLRTGAMVTIHR